MVQITRAHGHGLDELRLTAKGVAMAHDVNCRVLHIDFIMGDGRRLGLSS
jgi:hypothetical protein